MSETIPDVATAAQVLIDEFLSDEGIADEHCTLINLESLEHRHKLLSLAEERRSERMILHIKDRLGLCRDQGVQKCLWCRYAIIFRDGYWCTEGRGEHDIMNNYGCPQHATVTAYDDSSPFDDGHEPDYYIPGGPMTRTSFAL